MEETFSMTLTADDIKAQQQQNQSEVNIVDTTRYMQLFNEMVEFIKTPKMQEMKINNPANYNNQINLKNNGDLSYSILRLLNEDINNEHKIRDMISILDECRSGKKNIEKETEQFNEKVSEEYLFPSFGGKENYYKKIAEGQEKIKKEQEEKKQKQKDEETDSTNKKKELKKATFAGGRRI
jgi:hypothetical protein